MYLTPFRRDPVNSLQTQMNRLFEDFFGPESRTVRAAWLPAVNVSENPEAIIVEAEVPGIDPKAVEIAVVGDALHLRGEKKDETEEKGKNWHRVERRYGSFERVIPLPSAVAADKVEAEAKDGVIRVTLPKRDEVKARRIEVKG